MVDNFKYNDPKLQVYEALAIAEERNQEIERLRRENEELRKNLGINPSTDQQNTDPNLSVPSFKDHITNAVATVGQAVVELKNKVRDLTERVEKMSNDIRINQGNLEGKFNEVEREVNDSISNIQDRRNSDTAKNMIIFEGLQTAVEELVGRVDNGYRNIERSNKEMGERIESINKNIEEWINKNVEEKIESTKRSIAVLNIQKEEMEKKLIEQQAQQREQQRKEKEEQDKKIKDTMNTQSVAQQKQHDEALKKQRDAEEKLIRDQDAQEERRKEKEQEDELKKALQMEKETMEKREREEQEQRKKEQRERERRVKEEQRRNSKIIGMFCQSPGEYEVISNIEVHNQSRFMMQLTEVTMHRGVAEIPPTNVGPNEILRCGFHKVKFSDWGCGAKICWCYIMDGINYYLTLYFDTIYKTFYYRKSNGIGLELTTENNLIEKVKDEGKKMLKLDNNLISVTASTRDTNHNMIIMFIDDL